MVIFLHFIKQLEQRTTVCVQTVEPQAGSRPAALIAFLTDDIYSLHCTVLYIPEIMKIRSPRQF